MTSGPQFHELLQHALEQRPAVEIAGRRALDGWSPPGGFWRRLERVRAEVGDRDPPLVPVTGIVGPLAATIPIVHRTLSQHRADGCEVTVLTRRAEIVSEPSWRLVRDGHRLVEVAANRQHAFALLVVDAGPELAPWVRPLVARLRDAGMGLVRYVVAGDPTDDRLAAGGDMLGQPLVVDLVQPAEPARVLALTGRGEPIATVGGTPLTAELVLAMEAEVAGG